ncbi:hypothetical protein [Janthinobacterium sp. 13]|uniref:hypothetical protein n=1 Tax=Janthinobacterium sp. 13 TaxID=2035211 RepID=UPI00117AE9D0|nr:hypothetical protein [Janthinobacterium sp. 13]
MWTQLGIFAANTVRVGLAESYTYANAFDSTAQMIEHSDRFFSKEAGSALRSGADSIRAMVPDTMRTAGRVGGCGFSGHDAYDRWRGGHEQGNLQIMWNKPAMINFAKTNAFLIQNFGVSLVRLNIHLGANPTTDSLRSTDSRSLWLKAPLGSEDLTSLETGFQLLATVSKSSTRYGNRKAAIALLNTTRIN